MKTEKGFTLVEMISVLIILGLVGAAGTMGFAEAVRGFIFAEDTINIADKAKVAIDRMSLELTHIAYNPPASHVLHDGSLTGTDGNPLVGYAVTASSQNSITFNTDYGQLRGSETGLTLALTGNQLTLDNEVLCDNVSGFTLSYLDSSDPPVASTTFTPLTTRSIEVTLVVQDFNNNDITFTTSIVPKFPY